MGADIFETGSLSNNPEETEEVSTPKMYQIEDLPNDRGEYITTGSFDGSGYSGYRKDLEEQGKISPLVSSDDDLG